MGTIISGTGVAIPSHVVTNDMLAGVMDTSDEWISARSGVKERRYVEPGTTTSDLAAHAGAEAIADAGIDPGTIDAVVTATMTPDLVNPGIAGLVQEKLGLGQVAVYDVRQQCSGFLYGLDIADALIASGKAENVAVIGAEVHSGYMPWDESVWSYLRNETTKPPGDEARSRATEYREWSVLFGDGAGAAVVSSHSGPESGFGRFHLATDGTHFDLILIPGVGFSHRPYVDAAQIESEMQLPTMRGRRLFKQAVDKMPSALRTALEHEGLSVSDLDVVVAHQANARIVNAVARALDAEPDVVPINIDSYGNTTAGTLPILYHELRKAGRIHPGAVIGFVAFGAGAHWGAVVYREPPP